MISYFIVRRPNGKHVVMPTERGGKITLSNITALCGQEKDFARAKARAARLNMLTPTKEDKP